MKPQSEAFLEKANELLGRAAKMLDAGLYEDAGRAAYLVGFHAAQALIFERDERVFKTHKGVQSEFARLMKTDPRFDVAQRPFLGQTYSLKTMADYETGPLSEVTKTQAVSAVDAARSFSAHVTSLLVDQPD